MGLGIRTKIILLISFALATVIAVAIAIGYFRGMALLRGTITYDYAKIAQALSASVSYMIDSKIEERIGDSSRMLWRKQIQENNLKYATMDEESIKKYFMDMNKKWVQEPAESALFSQYLENDSSLTLKEIVGQERETAEIFITDKFGGLVASSEKTSDFYQADEEWWQKAFNLGKGSIYVGDIEYDKSSDSWGIAVAVPIRDSESQVIGISKCVIDINKFFEPLNHFSIGKSGHATIIDKQGNILFYTGLLSMTRFDDALSSWASIRDRNDYSVVYSSFHKKKVFISAPAALSGYAENVLPWKVMVVQDEQEIFAPLRELIRQILTLAAIAVLMIPLAGFIFGSTFIKPLKKLYHATKEISSGNLNYKIELKTGDELEVLATSFNRMSDTLQKTLVSKDYVDSIMKSMLDTLVVTTPDKKIMTVNRAFCELLNYKEEELIGRKIGLILVGDGMYSDAMEFLASKEQHHVNSYETRYKTRDGRLIPVLLSSSIITGKDGMIRYRVYTAKDITERKKYEEELKKSCQLLSDTQGHLLQASKMSAIGQLAGGVAHEINNPLTGVINNIQLIKMIAADKKEFTFEEFKELLNIIEESAMRCRKITQALLDLSHVSKGGFESVCLNVLVEKVFTLIKQEMLLENITLQKSLQPDLHDLQGDTQLLEQVILNLIANAKWAIQKKGRKHEGTITVKTWQEPDKKSVFLSVSDDGIGIAQENLAKMFEPFFTTKEVGEGTGLGLAMAYNIIKSHNGIFDVKSTLNVGTTFTVCIPYASRIQNPERT
ncbi:MAG: PAS domain S-box protein [Candidatus Omnitrophica bacterium]|nr:PAS domain S-box protein [Candidatus Omnitrophota bacterium]